MEPIINQQMPEPETKNKTWLWIIVIILVAGLVGAGVYYWQNMEAKKMATSAEEKVRSEMQVKITEADSKIAELENKITEKQKNIDELTLQIRANIFDPNLLKIGDKVVNMTTTALQALDTNKTINIPENYTVDFTGQVNINGTFYFNDLLGRYCFTVDQADWNKLPKPSHDTRNPALCFNETSEIVVEKIKTQKDKLSNIVIDNYSILSSLNEVSNRAELIKINN